MVYTKHATPPLAEQDMTSFQKVAGFRNEIELLIIILTFLAMIYIKGKILMVNLTKSVTFS